MISVTPVPLLSVNSSKLVFIYKEFDLYRSLAIYGIWHNITSNHLQEDRRSTSLPNDRDYL